MAVDKISGPAPSPEPVIVLKTTPELFRRLKQERAMQRHVTMSNEFDVRRTIDSSSDGEVYLLDSKTTEATFVVKSNHPELVEEATRAAGEVVGDFKYPVEAKVLLRLRPHPNIIQLIVAEEEHEPPGQWNLWFENCKGGDLQYQIDYWWTKRQKAIPEVFLLHLIVSLFEGLAFLHSGLRYHAESGEYTRDEDHEAVVHGDLKPGNIFLRWHPTRPYFGGMPEIVIGDFGTAKFASETDAKVLPGTFEFHAPEDVAMYHPADFCAEQLEKFYEMTRLRKSPSDVWAIGQVLYVAARMKGWRQFPIDGNPAGIDILPAYRTMGLRGFIVRCLQHDPSKRGTADFDDTTGLLKRVQLLRRARGELAKKEPIVDPMEWRLPRPISSCTKAVSLVHSLSYAAKGLHLESCIDEIT
ncbi:hypothetical protein AC579_2045 [Pseudocercospora musae]|uniref:non-specific serine/threonine protein kinase n=1 Tax=Pseudocercospora musae TaxID=113226 RepID=A0A139IC50_9PEZI|nr:hypothetical protein AC579_2045 [Pseudocercospora musae]